jgi:hypothetical protein
MIEPHSSIGQSAWLDLLRLLKDNDISDIRGTPRRKTVRGHEYWYDQYRIGTKVVDRYIGEDSDELRAKMERHLELASERENRRKEAARLMRVLRAEGYLAADVATGQLISAFARSGVFRLGGTLVGTHAFRLYEGVLGVRLGLDRSAMTDDIDIASFERLSVALGDTVDPQLSDVFKELSFRPLPSTDNRHTWRWEQTDRQTLVEFLAPSFGETDGFKDLPALGVSAQPLHFLNYLIAEPIKAPLLYRSGILVQIPRPEAYAVHKLIVAQRRKGDDALKARKDLDQSAFLFEVLAEQRPDELLEAYDDARDRGPSWREAIDHSLSKRPDIAAHLDRCRSDYGM